MGLMSDWAKTMWSSVHTSHERKSKDAFLTPLWRQYLSTCVNHLQQMCDVKIHFAFASELVLSRTAGCNWLVLDRLDCLIAYLIIGLSRRATFVPVAFT